MVTPTVKFEIQGDELHLFYSPRDDDEWVHAKFDRGEPLVIKGTYRLTKADLVTSTDEDEDDEGYPLRFSLPAAAETI